jgi:hypothetical protein
LSVQQDKVPSLLTSIEADTRKPDEGRPALSLTPFLRRDQLEVFRDDNPAKR